MDIHESLEKLEHDYSHKKFMNEHSKSYLCHFFMMMDNDIKNDWQIGFYDPETDLVKTYLVSKSEIVSDEPQQVFKEPGSIVERLELDKIKTSYDSAIQTSQKCLKENYPKIITSKRIILLQKIKDIGTVWNITYMTLNYDTINIRISVDEPRIISHEKKALVGFDPSDFEKGQDETNSENQEEIDFEE